jgi:L-ascorbate metabolism protein UlaG (beta-lactamase superfamily)
VDDVAGGRLTYVGHATVLIELGGARLLTDPFLRNWLGHLRRHGVRPGREVGRDLDAVLVSHLHRDHLDLPSLRRLGRGVRLVVPRGAGSFLHGHGFSRIEELAAGESVTMGALEVEAVPAEHDGRRGPLGPSAEAIGFVVRGPKAIYFAGDTDLFPGLERLAGSLDVALLPVWGWGPTIGEGHMDPGRAARAAALLRPRLAVPIHWGTLYPRGLSRSRPAPLREPPRAFAAQVAELAPDVEVRVLEPGASIPL